MDVQNPVAAITLVFATLFAAAPFPHHCKVTENLSELSPRNVLVCCTCRKPLMLCFGYAYGSESGTQKLSMFKANPMHVRLLDFGQSSYHLDKKNYPRAFFVCHVFVHCQKISANVLLHQNTCAGRFPTTDLFSDDQLLMRGTTLMRKRTQHFSFDLRATLLRSPRKQTEHMWHL